MWGGFGGILCVTVSLSSLFGLCHGAITFQNEKNISNVIPSDFQVGFLQPCEHLGALKSVAIGASDYVVYLGSASQCGGLCTPLFYLFKLGVSGGSLDVTSTVPGAAGVLAPNIIVADLNNDLIQDVFYTGLVGYEFSQTTQIMLRGKASVGVNESAFDVLVNPFPQLKHFFFGQAQAVDLNKDGLNDIVTSGYVGILSEFVAGIQGPGGNFTDQSATLFPHFTGLLFATPRFAFGNITGGQFDDMFITYARIQSLDNLIPTMKLFHNYGNGSGYVDVSAAFGVPSGPTVQLCLGNVILFDFDGFEETTEILINGKYNWTLEGNNAATGNLFLRLNRTQFVNGVGKFENVTAYVLQDFPPLSYEGIDVYTNGSSSPFVFGTGLSKKAEDVNIGGLYQYDRTMGRFVNMSNLLKTPPTYVHYASALFADVNGDGHKDILFAGNVIRNGAVLLGRMQYYRFDSSSVSYDENDEVFLPSYSLSPVGGFALTVDWNADGCPDFFLSGFQRSTPKGLILLMTSNCNNSFQESSLPPETKLTGFTQMVEADFDKNGYPDYFYTGLTNLYLAYSTDWAMIAVKNSSGTPDLVFIEPVITRPPNGSAALGGLGVLDYNNDGYPDVVLTGSSSDTITLYQTPALYLLKNLRNLTFSTETSPFLGGYQPIMLSGVLVSDLNYDNFNDILVSGTSERLVLPFGFTSSSTLEAKFLRFAYINMRNGSFMNRTLDVFGKIPEYFYPTMRAADFDNDGILNIAYTGVANQYANNILMLLNVLPNGTLVQASNTSFPTGLRVFLGDIAWVDYNADGLLDMIATGSNQTDINVPVPVNYVFQNVGGGRLVDVTSSTGLPAVLDGMFDGRLAVIPSPKNATVVSTPSIAFYGSQKCTPVLFVKYRSADLPSATTTADSSASSSAGSSSSNDSVLGAALGGTLGGLALLLMCVIPCVFLCCCCLFAVVIFAVILAALVVTALIAAAALGLFGAADGVVLALFVRNRRKKMNSQHDNGYESDETVDEADLLALAEEITEYRKIDRSEISLVRKLGEGAFGEVLLGNWNGVEVAVKVFRAPTMAMVQEFHHEALLMAKVSHHPHIVGFIGAMFEEQSVSMVMQLCAGGSLYQALLQKRVSESDKWMILRDVASAMSFLHQIGMVHRDLAARNILLDGNGTAKVSDFGLSRVLMENQTEQQTDSYIGPIRWMAPESIEKRKYSAASDSYSFGVLMYEIFTDGATPFAQYTNVGDVALAKVRRNETAGIPVGAPRLATSLMPRLWSKDPETRPTMSDILSAINEDVYSEAASAGSHLGDPADLAHSAISYVPPPDSDEYIAAGVANKPASGSHEYISAQNVQTSSSNEYIAAQNVRGM